MHQYIILLGVAGTCLWIRFSNDR